MADITRRDFINSLVGIASASTYACALNPKYKSQYNLANVNLWRPGSDIVLAEYDGSVFHIWGLPAEQGENPVMFVDRVSKLMGAGNFKPDVLKKGADLLKIIEGNGEIINIQEGESKQVKLKIPADLTTLIPGKDYIIPIPSHQYSSIKQAKEEYKRQVNSK